MTISRVSGSSDPGAWPVVWRARSDGDDTALGSLPVVDEIVGYTVTTDDGWPLREGVRYAVTDATDEDGYNQLAVVLEFVVADLREGAVEADPPTEQNFDTWLGPAGPECGN